MNNMHSLAAENTITTLQTIADLKAYEPTASGETVLVKEYYK